MLSTGEATDGHGGDIRVRVGTGHSDDGGDVLISAGETTASTFTGGAVILTGGEGSSTYAYDGGNGGVVQIYGGAGQGGLDSDDGGNIEIAGGYSRVARGGSYLVRTGYGEYSSSGIIDISTANAGSNGVSGDLDLSTGTSSLGNTVMLISKLEKLLMEKQGIFTCLLEPAIQALAGILSCTLE